MLLGWRTDGPRCTLLISLLVLSFMEMSNGMSSEVGWN